MKKIKLLAAAVLIGIASIFGSSASATVLDFNAFSPSVNFNSISEDGFNIVGSGTGLHFVSSGGSSFCSPGCPENGTNHLLTQGSVLFTISAQDSSTFTFVGFDGAESFLGLTNVWADSIKVTGSRSDATTVVQVFDLDFINDGDGPLNDFQTFTANGFTNVVSIVFEAVGQGSNDFSLDNITLSVASPVPEPGALALLGVGLLGLGVARRRRVLSS